MYALEDALRFNGSADLIDGKFALLHFYVPDTQATVTSADSESLASSGGRLHENVVLRKVQEILNDPHQYQNTQSVPFCRVEDHNSEIAESGALTNTFLIIDTSCIESVIPNYVDPHYEDMRILAFEAAFPVPNRKYLDGYSGWSWIRLDQLVYHFYHLRQTKAKETGMDEIWKAAQVTRSQAFVSMQPGEALSRSHSSAMRGYTPKSVIGKRWYALKDERQERGEATP